MFYVSELRPIHNVEISYLLENMEEAGVHSSLFDTATQQFFRSIRKGDRKSAEQMQHHLEIVLQQIPDDGQGLRVGDLVTVKDLGAFGHAYLSSRNLRSVHQLILTYRKILRTIHDISIDYGEKSFTYSVTGLRAQGRTARFFIECWVRSQYNAMKNLLGEARPFELVEFTFKPPVYASMLEDSLGCPVYYRRKQNVYQAPNRLLDMPFSFANDEVKNFCEMQCGRIMRAMEAGEETVTRARQALLRKPGWFPNCDELAQELGYSSRTFRRRLQQESSNYQAVMESVRKELAANYLRNTDLTVEMIAYRLGYEEANSFYKAFRRWYGTSPKAYSQAH